MRSSNPSVQGFAYETYALIHLLTYPRKFNIPTLDQQEIQIKSFRGEFPESSLLNCETNTAVLFWPNKWNKKFVDAVLRFISPQKLLFLVGIQVTHEKIINHLKSYSFFSFASNAGFKGFLKQVEYEQLKNPEKFPETFTKKEPAVQIGFAWARSEEDTPTAPEITKTRQGPTGFRGHYFSLYIPFSQ